MFIRVFEALYGDVPCHLVKRYGLLSLASFFLLGSLSLLAPFKAVLKRLPLLRGVEPAVYARFLKTIGSLEMYALLMALGIFIVYSLLYNGLRDLTGSTALYKITFLGYGMMLAATAFQVAITCDVFPDALGVGGFRGMFYLFYLVDVVRILLVSLFWSYVAGQATVEEGKLGIVVLSGFGMLGVVTALHLSSLVTSIGIVNLLMVILAAYALGSGLFFSVMHMSQPVAVQRNQESALMVFGTSSYVWGVMLLSTSTWIIVFTSRWMLRLSLPEKLIYKDVLCLLGRYGMYEKVAAALCAFVLTSMMLRALGVLNTLVVVSAIIGSACLITMAPYTEFKSVPYVALAFLHGMYGPISELFYIPISSGVRFKVRLWVGFLSATIASFIFSAAQRYIPTSTRAIGGVSIMLLVVVCMWIALALCVGRYFESFAGHGKKNMGVSPHAIDS
jgi:hypothetical protein